jgi:hypothetical protein
MEKITVEKGELLDKLRANRKDHQLIFQEALKGFAEKVSAELERSLADIRGGQRRDVRVWHAAPKDHSSDYDRAIAMIEMAVGDTIVLSENDFTQYVMDDWGWQDQFLSNTYGSRTAEGKFSARYDVR